MHIDTDNDHKNNHTVEDNHDEQPIPDSELLYKSKTSRKTKTDDALQEFKATLLSGVIDNPISDCKGEKIEQNI